MGDIENRIANEEREKIINQKMKHTLIDFRPSLLSIVFLIWAITMTILYINVVDEQNDIRKSTTSYETNTRAFEANETFRQRFHVATGRLFSENEIQILQYNMEAYTKNRVLSTHNDCNKLNEDIDGNGLINNDDVIKMTSTVMNQQESNNIDFDFVNEVTYIVSFDSIHNCSDLDEFPRTYFPNYTNRNLDQIRNDLNILTPGINITMIEMAGRIVHHRMN